MLEAKECLASVFLIAQSVQHVHSEDVMVDIEETADGGGDVQFSKHLTAEEQAALCRMDIQIRTNFEACCTPSAGPIMHQRREVRSSGGHGAGN